MRKPRFSAGLAGGSTSKNQQAPVATSKTAAAPGPKPTSSRGSRPGQQQGRAKATFYLLPEAKARLAELQRRRRNAGRWESSDFSSLVSEAILALADEEKAAKP